MRICSLLLWLWPPWLILPLLFVIIFSSFRCYRNRTRREHLSFFAFLFFGSDELIISSCMYMYKRRKHSRTIVATKCRSIYYRIGKWHSVKIVLCVKKLTIIYVIMNYSIDWNNHLHFSSIFQYITTFAYCVNELFDQVSTNLLVILASDNSNVYTDNYKMSFICWYSHTDAE